MDSRWMSDATGDSADQRLTSSNRDTLLLKCKSAIEVLSDELEQERKTRIATERKLLSLRNDLSTLEEELSMLRRRDETFAGEVETEVREKSTMRRKIVVLEEEVSRVSQENSELTSKCSALMDELECAHRLLDQARHEISDKQGCIDEWGDTVAAVEMRLRSLSGENENIKKERDKYVENCEKILASNEKLEELWKTAKSESQEVYQKLERLREQHMEKVAEYERDKARQHQSLTESFSQKTLVFHEEMQKEVRELKADKDAAVKEAARLTDENNKLTAQLTLLQSQFSVVRNDLELSEKDRKSLETELKVQKSELESLCGEYKREAEMKEKLYSGAVARMEEEIRAHDQTRRRVEELAGKLSQNELIASSAVGEYERKVEDCLDELRRKSNESEELRDKLANLQRETNDTLARVKKDQFDTVSRVKLEANRCQSDAVRELEERLKQVEEQRVADHDQYQIEILRLKDEYTQALISSGEELKDLRKDRNRSRSTIAELERRITSLTEKVAGRASGKRGVNLQLAGFSEEENDGVKEGDGVKFLGQLRNLTEKLERSVQGNRF